MDIVKKEFVSMPVDWDTEDEIQHHYSLEAAFKSAQQDADYYGIAFEVIGVFTYADGTEKVQSHEIDPTPMVPHPGNYYWDTKGKYEFAAMMQD